jgi:flagellar basal body P-ring protein FlgI
VNHQVESHVGEIRELNATIDKLNREIISLKAENQRLIELLQEINIDDCFSDEVGIHNMQ